MRCVSAHLFVFILLFAGPFGTSAPILPLSGPEEVLLHEITGKQYAKAEKADIYKYRGG